MEEVIPIEYDSSDDENVQNFNLTKPLEPLSSSSS